VPASRYVSLINYFSILGTTVYRHRIWLYHYEGGNSFSVRLVYANEQLDASHYHPICRHVFHLRLTNRPRGCLQLIMPTWFANEQADYQFISPNLSSKANTGRKLRCALTIASFIQVALENKDPATKIKQLCLRAFKVGFDGTEDSVSDVLVHRNPVK